MMCFRFNETAEKHLEKQRFIRMGYKVKVVV